nr:PREDICTED: E3 ubiquitin-protein ligase RNF13 isoform X3 [Lepisosteus oculatus]
MLLSLGMLMLSATQIYTIFTVQLFAFLNLLPVEADISAYSFDNKSQNFDDLPARFGYRLPSEGLKGFLIGARPENACEPIDPPPVKGNLTGAFIVLIKRFDCNFDVKGRLPFWMCSRVRPSVPRESSFLSRLLGRYWTSLAGRFLSRPHQDGGNSTEQNSELLDRSAGIVRVLNAQKAGYKAAIVHNVDSDDLISMGSNDLDILKQIDIPSVFVGEDTARSLKEDYVYEKGGHVVLMPDFSLPLEYYLIPFLIIVGICLILIVVFMITKFVQDRHRARRSRLRKDQLKKLPVHKYRKECVGALRKEIIGLMCLEKQPTESHPCTTGAGHDVACWRAPPPP